MEGIYVNKDELNEIIENGNGIFLFGTGVDAERICSGPDVVNAVIAFVDNNRSGDGHQYLGKDIINVNQFLEMKRDGQPIIIAAGRYAAEISRQLTGENLVPGKDFFVWDDEMLFHHNDITIKHVAFLKEIWAPHKRSNKDNKILIAFDNKCWLTHIKFAYYANYLAEKWDASIYGYFQWGSNIHNASPVVKDIYSAINMEELIDTTLAEDQKEADQILDELWDSLDTWEDWKNITVNGYKFGTTVIRDFLRTELPDFDLKSEKMHRFLKETIDTIVFWEHYFDRNNVVAVLCVDGVTWEGYIRDIAVRRGIPAYEIACGCLRRLELDYYTYTYCNYYKDMWQQLTDREKDLGMKWAREHLYWRISGNPDEENGVDKKKFAFSQKMKEYRVLNDNTKLKLVICPHLFEEDCYHCGEQIFDNNYFAWLCHLGELSDRTPEYDWYLKMHPTASKRDFVITDMLLKRYPRIRRLPDDVSPQQMKQEGIKYALTVCGTIGHEYPAIGIQVINAGRNMHEEYDFNWNPKTKEEYDSLIMHLNELEPKTDDDGLLQFYSMHYLIYDVKRLSFDHLFFNKEYLGKLRDELLFIGKKTGAWMYEEYMEEWTEERHKQAYQQMEHAFQEADNWRPDVFYKSSTFLDLCRDSQTE